jgi:hypothetical protein
MNESRHRKAMPAVGLVAVLIALAGLAGTANAAGPVQAKATIEAREALFGPKNVDRRGMLRKDRVIVSWFGVSSLAVSFDGKVVLLDTYINSDQPASCSISGAPPESPAATGYTPLNYDQLTAVEPKAMFLGHGHFDHECMTGPIAAQTGARVVGLPQHCALAKSQATGAGLDPDDVRCVGTLAADSPFGTTRKIKPLGRRIPVIVIRNVHSGPATLPALNSTGFESLMFRFKLGKFSLFWNDSAGPLREAAPDLLAQLQNSPPADVEFGATFGLGVNEQGMRDPADYAEALRVKAFYALHQDLPRSPAASAGFLDQAASEFATRGIGSVLRPLQDPADYLQPRVFNPDAARWTK